VLELSGKILMNTPQPKVASVPDVLRGIQKLESLILDLNALGADQVRHDSGRVGNTELEIERTVEGIFGAGSKEHNLYGGFRIAKHSGRKGRILASPQERDYLKQKAFLVGIPVAAEKLEGFARRLQEFKRCPKCNFASEDMNFCTEHGNPLVNLSYDSDAETLVLPDPNEKS
jgi:hypothetical protein